MSKNSDNFITCSLPTEGDHLSETVKDVQTHHHTKTCTKKSSSCRFGFPKFSAERTLIARQPASKDGKLVAHSRQILLRAKKLLTSPNPPTNFYDFFKLLNVSSEEYHSALSVSSKGNVVIQKRKFDELFTNNYNRHWLEAWNANMDLQYCCDTYAVVTYICDYYSKDETGVTDVFKQVVKQQADQRKSVHDMLRLLKNVYLTHRQVGACEATYRLLPSLHLKDSNITSVFLTKGFPENRYHFLKWIEDQDTQQDTVEIEGREEKYVWTMTVHEKYSMRPSFLDDICLADFVINYTFAPRDASETNNDECKTKRSLPSKVTLEDNGGVMRLREVPCVLRLHESRKKN